MHYRSLLRVARRQSGTRVYTAIEHPLPDASEAGRAARAAALVDLVVRLHAPLPSASLGYLVSLLLAFGAPHLSRELKAALRDSRASLAGTRIDGTAWFWPVDEDPRSKRWKVEPMARILAPFDPIVWDRRRFERLWGWTYRFEAYTPAARRKLGYYALPLLFGDRVVGWVNANVRAGRLSTEVKFIDGRPRDPAFRDAWLDERSRFAEFLGV